MDRVRVREAFLDVDVGSSGILDRWAGKHVVGGLRGRGREHEGLPVTSGSTQRMNVGSNGHPCCPEAGGACTQQVMWPSYVMCSPANGRAARVGNG